MIKPIPYRITCAIRSGSPLLVQSLLEGLSNKISPHTSKKVASKVLDSDLQDMNFGV